MLFQLPNKPPQLKASVAQTFFDNSSHRIFDVEINMAENENPSSIDETPISPVQRRDSLEKHLQTRPDPQDLKNRNILLNTTAAP